MSENLAPAPGGQGAAAMLSAEPAAPTVPASVQVAPPAAAPTAQPVSWLEGADELTTGYVQNKGWDNPAKVVDSYRNLEKLFGADKAGNTVVLPKEGATPEEMGKFYDRLGRPSAPDGYKIDIPEQHGSKDFATAAASKMHELGLSKAQGEALAAWWNEQAGNGISNVQAQQAQAIDAGRVALKEEWGAAFTQSLAAAQQGARALGLDGATIDQMETTMGHQKLMNMLKAVGEKIGEPDFVSGKGEGFGAMTPGQAKDKILQLRSDKEWVAKYINGDAGARSEMERLHKFAHPEGL